MYINEYIKDLSDGVKTEGKTKEEIFKIVESIQECAESASRKWERMDQTLDIVDKLVANTKKLSSELEERDREIATIKANASKENSRIPPDELKKMLDLGVPE